MSTEDSNYRILPTFDTGLEEWPIFKLKFCIFLKMKKLLYVVDHKTNLPETGDTGETVALKAVQATTHMDDDVKVQSYLLNKLGNDTVIC